MHVSNSLTFIVCFSDATIMTMLSTVLFLIVFVLFLYILRCYILLYIYVFILNVVHVFQADFATSAVDFLHRIGRTARAGQIGLVTSMYTESNRELVDAVRRAGELGLPVVNYKTVFIGRSNLGQIHTH